MTCWRLISTASRIAAPNFALIASMSGSSLISTVGIVAGPRALHWRLERLLLLVRGLCPTSRVRHLFPSLHRRVLPGFDLAVYSLGLPSYTRVRLICAH